ncbi:MAG: N-acetyl-gamma-glutamyl-phosphate reductase [Ruminococcaceae bacterium]|nr:N-acetyl-gamma-glutamyl-phosphate reductase [Oscillospiraceae bacterium]
MKKIFIDGSAGTTGLRIHQRLAERKDLQVITLSDDCRKDPAARKEALNSADIAFLCLPDAAAVESASFVENSNTVVIDTSTAHRVDPNWTYGFPELKGQREKIVSSKRIANPGCHASGVVALVAPLMREGLLKKDVQLSCFSLTGYSGGGKQMIAEYEGAERDKLLDAPRLYGLTQSHKHLKEIVSLCSLKNVPAFCPIVAPFYSGMEVSVPVFAQDLNCSKKELEEFFAAYYQNGLIHFAAEADENGFLSSGAFSGRDDLQITVTGNDERMLLTARFDNLGKGASGAAIQNMNLILGVPEDTGLTV